MSTGSDEYQEVSGAKLQGLTKVLRLIKRQTQIKSDIAGARAFHAHRVLRGTQRDPERFREPQSWNSRH